jgi:hypothetical protein
MLNCLIRLLTRFTPEMQGNPDEWLERPWVSPIDGEIWHEFNCGSVRGIYRPHHKEFQILAVQNTAKKKNDHFDRVLKWFEQSYRREHYALTFLDVENPRLLEKLQRLGFAGTYEKMTKSYV